MTDEPTATRLKRMVTALGPLEEAVARAMERVPRERFVPPNYRSRAYDDEPIPLPGIEATISAPHMAAIQLETAQLRPGLSVLEVGSGSGYLLALLSEIVGPEGRVVGIELDRSLAEGSMRTLADLGLGPNVVVRCSDGLGGAPDLAPFDRIVVSCAVREIAQVWRDELRPDGWIIAPVGDRSSQTLIAAGRDPMAKVRVGPRCRFVGIRAPSHRIYRP